MQGVNVLLFFPILLLFLVLAVAVMVAVEEAMVVLVVDIHVAFVVVLEAGKDLVFNASLRRPSQVNTAACDELLLLHSLSSSISVRGQGRL